jgi:broad specificity phosphatase PhoE
MIRVSFIRHGKRDNRLVWDPSLTPEGRAEAGLLAAQLASLNITEIFISPLARASETAGIIGTTLALEVVENLRLRERMNWGDFEGQTFDDFVAEWDRCSRERDFQPSVGDSSIGAGRRIESFVSDCHARSLGSVVAVTHGGVLADFLLNVFLLDELDRVRSEFRAHPYSSDVIPECSLTTVDYDGSRYRLRALGVIMFGGTL